MRVRPPSRNKICLPPLPHSGALLRRGLGGFILNLKTVAENGGNVFEVTLEIVKEITIDEWTRALQEVCGMYRRKI